MAEKGLSANELKALVQNEMRASLGYSSSKLSAARQKAEYYYLGLPVGDLSPPEIEGRSTVVSTDVRDTVEAMLPQLMLTFCGGDQVVEFEPQGPEDEGKAKLATEYVNYLFFRKNNGHRIAYTWMKDALLQKNGIVKVWWDTRHEETKEEYRALDEIELAQVLDDKEVEVVSQDTYPDEDDAKQRQQAIEQMTQQMAQMMQANPQMAAHMQQQIAQLQAQPPKMLYDVVCKRTAKQGKICIENVPPEEFLIARSAKDIQTARFVGHRVQRTKSELRSMGYKNVDNISGEDQAQGQNIERIQRLSWNDENAYASDETSMDESQRVVWVTEAYLRADYDGDGIAELRKVTLAGNEMLDNEEVDFIPFVSITPIPLPHVFFGLSVADLAMETQKERTSVRRAINDNLYMQVNGRYFAVENQVNLDDLLTSRPGGVVRIKTPGAVGRLDQGQGDIGFAINLLETLQQELENRTGWSRQSMGNDASGLHTTATAANIVTNKADMRVDLISRNFAEGYTELFRFVLKLVCQYQDRPAMAKLSGGWASIDPREWRNQFDTSINVGIGLGNKDQKVQHMMLLGQAQQAGLAIGLATPEHLYNTATELSKLLGYKNADRFFTNPTKNPQPKQPHPEQIKAQSQMQIEQARLQANAQIEQLKLQQQAQLDEVSRQHEMALEQARMQMQAEVDTNRQAAEAQQKALEVQQQAELDTLRMQHENERHQREMEFKAWSEHLKAKTSVIVAKIGASSKPDAGEGEDAGELGMEADEALGLSGEPSKTEMLMALMQNVGDAVSSLRDGVGGLQQGVAGMHHALTKPKTVIRGPDGRVQGVM